MFPNFFGFSGVYSFGVSVTICFFLFAWMLKRLSKRLNFNYNLFTDNLALFFLSVFFFSRIFYIISRWNDLKYINSIPQFLGLSDYNFSLMGGIFGFLIILLLVLKIKKENLDNYIYGIILSLLFVLPIGFIGALLGGQVYGLDTNFGIEITYSNSISLVPYKTPIFPLPIIYAIVFFLTFSGFYILNMYLKQKALLGYLALIVFSVFIFFLEFFSGKRGLFLEYLGINLNQISAIFLIIFSIYRIYKIYTRNIEV